MGMAKIVDLPVASGHIAMATLSCFVLALSFGAIAYALTATGKARIASIGVATLIALGGYIVASLANLASWLEQLSKVFPFYYYRPGEILYGSYQWRNVIILIAVSAVAGLLAWIAFRRRDIVS
jgi:ABC-type transport system involved in multi-copper enzyme maturation permease subunit